MSKRVLVVDDEPPTARLIQTTLEKHGMEVCTAADGTECLQAIASNPPDLVILDVIMPVMDGFQTLRVLREKAETKGLPVIMLTARREDSDVLRGWMTGVDLYLTKPFKIEELVTAAKRILAAVEEEGKADEGDATTAGG